MRNICLLKHWCHGAKCTRYEKFLMFHNSLKKYLFPALQEFKHEFPIRTIKCGHPFSCHVAASFKYTENKGVAIYTKLITNYWKMKINVCNKGSQRAMINQRRCGNDKYRILCSIVCNHRNFNSPTFIDDTQYVRVVSDANMAAGRAFHETHFMRRGTIYAPVTYSFF